MSRVYEPQKPNSFSVGYLTLRDEELCKVSASKVRATFKEGRYDHKFYCEQVAAYDRGEKTLAELGWI